MMQNIKIFSYGTLQKSKFSRNREHKKGSITGAYALTNTAHSVLQELKKGHTTIKGILFSVTQDEINEIDDYEGLPHLFKRVEKVIDLDDGTKETAWVYILNE
jgi:gamma-glutamylcyclotransferase (GGCT)/AIG2-like uncharacterized protein YtfP